MSRTCRRLTPAALASTTIAALAALLGTLSPAGAEIHPYDARGVSPGFAYQVNDIDRVSLFNGNLVVSVPIGPSFPLDGGLSYRLVASYNSKVWDYAKLGNPQGFPETRKLPNPRSNAGLGWTVTLGRLFPPNSPGNDDFDSWLYQDPNGGEHLFHDTLHAGISMPGAEYSKDGTYLRMKVVQASPAVREIELPDGTIHRFEESSGWRLTQIRARFAVASAVNVSYSTPGQWILTDTEGRTHRVYLATFDYGQPGLPFQTAQMVTRVELAAFGPHPAVYDFVYQQITDLLIPCTPQDPIYQGPISVPVLKEIRLPDDDDPLDPNDPQSAWSFQYFEADSAPNLECRGGALAQIRAPTLGTIDYQYQRWDLPVTACQDPWDPWRRGDSTGIKARTVTPGFSQAAGTWTYSPSFSAEPPSRPPGYCPAAPPGIEIPREALLVTVLSPIGHERVHYFSVWPHSNPSLEGFVGREFGLPFTRHESDGSLPPRFLSTVTCEGSCANPANRVRQEYVRYEGHSGAFIGGTPENPRLSSSKAVYRDDSDRFSAVDRSDFDGLGHYRTEVATGNFVSGHTRAVTTDWNSGRGTYPGSWIPPATNDPWVLETFSSRKVEETDVRTCGGATETQIAWTEACFDASTGFLRRLRTMRTGSATLAASRSAQDVVTAYEQDPVNADGNVRFERSYGGDGGALPVGALCSATLPAPAYSAYHEYQHGVRSRSRFTDGDSNPGNDAPIAAYAFHSLDRTIDQDSGLPSSVRDVSGLQVNLEFDRMGRLTASKPSAAHGGAWESYAYPRASGATPAKLLHSVYGNGGFSALMLEEQTYFDGLGRVIRERRKRHDGQFDERYSFFNENGWKVFSGEWGRASAAQYGAALQDFDPFGRPRLVLRQTPTSSVAEAAFSYLGDREIRKTMGVGTVLGGGGVVFMEPVDTWERYDHFGRLVEVVEPSTGTLPGIPTSYGYDVGGRLKRAATDAPGATPDQVRCWEYDRRGYLTSERHPEKGVAGNGTVTYAGYDALGLPGSKADGGVVVGYLYDGAARLFKVVETSAASRTLKEWVFAAANSGSNWKRGRVETAIGWNYPVIDGTLIPIRFEETFTYGGPGGLASARDVRMLDGGTSLIDRFSHSESFDARGLRVGAQHPTCVPVPGQESKCPAESQVAFSTSAVYTLGFLTQVPGWASSISYHANSLWSSLVHANGVTDHQYLTPREAGGDLDNRPRPRLLKTKLAGSTLWSSGTFVYDFAGNITAMGETVPAEGELNHFGGVDRFLYDRVQRLKRGWITLADPPPLVCLFCDDFESADLCAWDATQPPVMCRPGPLGGSPPQAPVAPVAPLAPVTPLLVSRDQEYVYDLYGNIQTVLTDGVALSTTTDAATNHLIGTGTAYADGRGNLTSRAGVTFTYDALDRLVRRHASGDTRESLFFYTADDERILSFENEPPGSGLEERFHWTLRDLGGTVLRDYTSGAAGATQILCAAVDYVHRGAALLGAREHSCDPDGSPTPADTHYTSDHLGTPRLLTLASGAIAEERKYFPYGEDAKPANPEGPRLRFTGHERDPFDLAGTGDDLDYLHARFRSPLTGRFLSTDPVLTARALKRPQAWNRYTYTIGNPLKYIDPHGELWFKIDDKWTYLEGTDVIEEVTVKANGESSSRQVQGRGTFAAFNGSQLVLYGKDGSMRSYAAVSGRVDSLGRTQPGLVSMRNVGPIPEGRYSFNPQSIQNWNSLTGANQAASTLSPVAQGLGLGKYGAWPGGTYAWGTQRVPLTPAAGTDTLGRDNFFIHGGASPGSAGCIDLCHQAGDFFNAVAGGTEDIDVEVDY